MADASDKIKSQFRQGQVFSLILIVAASLFGMLVMIQLQREERALMQMRSQREETLQRYMEAMLNQESGFRGYLASDPRNKDFLKSYYEGVTQYGEAQSAARKIYEQPGEAAFQKVVAPLEEKARTWQQMATRSLGTLLNGGEIAGQEFPWAVYPRKEEFDAFRDAFTTARLRNDAEMLRRAHKRERLWQLEGLFVLSVMGIGVGAAIWIGRVAENTIGAQASQLVQQAESVRQHRQELSAQNETLQAQQAELQQRNRELELIGRITAIAASELRMDAIQDSLQEVLSALIPSDRCSIYLLEDTKSAVQVVSIHGLPIPGWQTGAVSPLPETLIGKALETARPIYLDDLSLLSEPLNAQARAFQAAGILSFVAAPLIARGQIIGTLNFASTTSRRYNTHTLSLIAQVAGSIAGALETTRLYQEEQRKSELLAVSIQETHHRVKNNLQAVSALLDVQLMEAGDMVPRESLERTITQVKAIALVHDLLSHDGTEESVDAKAVIAKLLPLVTLAYRDVGLEMSLVPLPLPMRQMTSLALVVNELALNALKHCGDKPCRLAVSSEVDAANRTARFVFQDDGPGFPPDFDPDRDANVGLQLVTTLVRSDLNGTILFENRGGACITLTFPLAPAPPSAASQRAVVSIARPAQVG